jgi:hypothetical protein
MPPYLDGVGEKHLRISLKRQTNLNAAFARRLR